MAGGKETKGTKAGKAKKPVKEAMTDIKTAGQNADHEAAQSASAPDTGGFEKMSQQVRTALAAETVRAPGQAHLQEVTYAL
jgi:hypothetical protein